MIAFFRIAFDLLLLWWLVSFILGKWGPRWYKQRRQLKMMAKNLKHRRVWDRDLIDEETDALLAELQQQAKALAKGPRTAFLVADSAALDEGKSKKNQKVPQKKPLVSEAEAFILNATERLGDTGEKAPSKWDALGLVREWTEVLVVVFGVVMGARALFLQPFKIPTGSMQPTLYGIHFQAVPPDEELKPGKLKRLVDYCNDSYRYVDAVSDVGGSLKGAAENNGFIFWPSLETRYGVEGQQFPGKPLNVLSYINDYQARYYPDNTGGSSMRHLPSHVPANHVLARGRLSLGDHLFVDRVTLHFSEPKRGDIIVFNTRGIKHNGSTLGGYFYIKRLVGLPNEKLQIREDGKLYVQEAGADDFRLVDGSDHVAFERMYSGKGGYCGYTQQGGHLFSNNGVITLGEDEYCLMGDNSANSMDSRYWGVVPRKNIVGKACFVYWPFSERWGPVDSIDPPDTPTTQCGRALEPLLPDAESIPQ